MPGLTWKRMLSVEGDPYAGILWEKRDALITNAKGATVFKQKDVEVPTTWSQLALNVVAQKYLRGYVEKDGTPGPNRETSVRQLLDRVTDTIAGWAGYECAHTTTENLGRTIVSFEIPPGWQGHVSFDDADGNPTSVTLDCGTVILPIRVLKVRTVVWKRPVQTMQKRDEIYFADKVSWEAWRDDLKHIVANQLFCFNSPVQFNVGVAEHPQCSACFIIRVEDWFTNDKGEDFDLDDHGLLAAQVKEGIIFSKGSGSGMNLSRIRSKKEWLSGGGKPTGPESFSRGYSVWAGQIKSGGKTRRAAKMHILDVDHPDIREFIHSKAKEEQVAKALIAAGREIEEVTGSNPWPDDMDGEAYQHAFHQNENISARVSDGFMKAVDARGTWELVSRSEHFLQDKPERMSMIGKKGRVIETVNAYDLMEELGRSCWECGDPGMQFSDTINEWHTCADTEPIVASNPCSEYLFLDETACNLGSFNLRLFLKRVQMSAGVKQVFDIEKFVACVRVCTVAMEVIVSNSKYPTPNFARMSDKYRTLGIGYANLGGMLMQLGIPYDSDEGRDICSAITSLLCAEAYATSAAMAKEIGPFQEFEANRKSCTYVMQKHQYESYDRTDKSHFPDTSWNALFEQANRQWDTVVEACEKGAGVRNAQATVLAPTGTIAFMMDCETTGIEPELGLMKFKALSGGGTLEIMNPLVAEILRERGMPETTIAELEAHLKAGKSIRTFGEQGVWALNERLCEVFRTSLPPQSEDRDFTLPWEAHIKMMAAAQPFISGAISKTVNMPNNATVQDMIGAYTMAWHLGLKAVALYRDGSKETQAIATSQGSDGSGTMVTKKMADQITGAVRGGQRKDLPARVPTDRFKFVIDGHKGYLHVGHYPDNGEVAEIFVKMAKHGSTLNGLIDGFCRAFSVGLQYGAPLADMATGYLETRFDPAGVVEHDSHVRSCRSILDYIAQKLLALDEERQRGGVAAVGVYEVPTLPETDKETVAVEKRVVKTGLVCRNCQGINVVMKGHCKVCMTCGSEEGGCYA